MINPPSPDEFDDHDALEHEPLDDSDPSDSAFEDDDFEDVVIEEIPVEDADDDPDIWEDPVEPPIIAPLPRLSSASTINPYHDGVGDPPDDAPFAGRQAALGALYRQLTDPARQRAFCFIGRRRTGKTALLQTFESGFGDAFISAYLPLDSTDMPAANERAFTLALAQAATAALIERNFTLTRLAALEPPGTDARAWLRETFLPLFFSILRAHRRFVFLIDDAEQLIIAVRAGNLPENTFAFLGELLAAFPGLSFALTLDSDYENDIPLLRGLIGTTEPFRLTHLAPDETRWLLTTPARPDYLVPDECAAAVHRATGGAPALVQHFGYQLYRRWRLTPDLNVLTLEDVKAVTPTIAQFAGEDYRAGWARLGAPERVVLNAISALYYQNPIGKIDAAALQAYLVNTDYPLDVTAIHAAMRGLEYREWIDHTPAGVILTAGLEQPWLLDNARLGERTPIRGRAETLLPIGALSVGGTVISSLQSDVGQGRRVPLVPMLVIGAILGIVLAMVILAVMTSIPEARILIAPPTVTLNP